ncbi:hypothetical protein QWL27_04805 [Streptomyces thermocarboxydus]|uniref:hypothetical protein n=1 Tax=Streptomyces TaxID=1883 RepID=UPI00167C1D6B|nr:hypothetical protein [Streptomyces sp. AC04842]MDN3285082.1 hypothetical protein [Streptomyces thermocarboxydus]GHE50246.1 hypothetical protein GCM10018771_34450 [Streptomyces cellulosae]
MSATQSDVAGTGGAEAPRGRTHWGVMTAILGLPALAVGVFLLMMAVWVLVS